MTYLDRLEALEKEATDNPFSLTKNMAYTAELKDAAPALIAVARAAQHAEGWMVAVRENDLDTFLEIALGEWLPVVIALDRLNAEAPE